MSDVDLQALCDRIFNQRDRYDTFVSLMKKAAIEIVAAEREACAKIAERAGDRQEQLTDTAFVPAANVFEKQAAQFIASAIRARSTSEPTP